MGWRANGAMGRPSMFRIHCAPGKLNYLQTSGETDDEGDRDSAALSGIDSDSRYGGFHCAGAGDGDDADVVFLPKGANFARRAVLGFDGEAGEPVKRHRGDAQS
jgi:hypothetical protein